LCGIARRLFPATREQDGVAAFKAGRHCEIIFLNNPFL
jgi:hypothetical protein